MPSFNHCVFFRIIFQLAFFSYINISNVSFFLSQRQIVKDLVYINPNFLYVNITFKLQDTSDTVGKFCIMYPKSRF